MTSLTSSEDGPLLTVQRIASYTHTQHYTVFIYYLELTSCYPFMTSTIYLTLAISRMDVGLL